MKKPCIILLSLVASQIILAQAPNKIWDVRFGGNLIDHCYDLHQTSDGGYILGGTSYSLATGDKSQPYYGSNSNGDYWIVKTDSNGVKQWNFRYGDHKDDNFTCMQQTSDGGYILGGYGVCVQEYDHSDSSHGGDDAWIIKLDANGTKQWDITLGGLKHDKLQVIEQTGDGGYILGITSVSDASGNKGLDSKGKEDYWIVKTDVNGVKLWEAEFGTNAPDYLVALHQTPDGGYIIGGYTVQGIDQDKSVPSKGGNDFWIVKTDANGVKQWDKDFGGSTEDTLSELILTQDGGYLLGGYSNSPADGDKSQGNWSNDTANDYWIVKIDSSGSKQWDYRYGGTGNDVLESISMANDGSFLLCGYSDSHPGGDKSQLPKGKNDYWMVRTNVNVLKQWDIQYGGTKDELQSEVIMTSTGAFVIGGSSASGIGGDKTQICRGNYDYWMVMMDESASNLLLIVPPGKTTLLRGEQLIVNYVSVGIINPGNFFSIEISDSSGSFASPTVIGTTSSISSGTIACTIPGNIDYGDAYRMRVRSSDPALLSADNGFNLIITPVGMPTKEWDATFGGSQGDGLSDVIQTNDGGYLIAGTSYSEMDGDKTQPGWSGGDYWILKTDSNGIKQWDRDFGGTSYDNLICILQQQMADIYSVEHRFQVLEGIKHHPTWVPMIFGL